MDTALFILSALGGLGGLAAFLQWMGVSPPQFRISMLRSGMPNRGKIVVGLSLFAVSLTLSGFGIYRVFRESDLPEFDTPNNALVLGWSVDKGFCTMTVSGDRVWSYRDNYRLATGCLVYDGAGDIKDAPYLQQSSLYDIRHGNIAMVAKYGEAFPKYMQEQHAAGNFVVLFLVPLGVTTSQFSTLRQARSLGVKIIANNLAKFEPIP